MFEIKFSTGNAAFNEDELDKRYECARILKEVYDKIRGGYDHGSCIDINGNKVGEWKLE